MSEVINHVYDVIDEENRDKTAATRRQLVAGAGVALGGMGLLAHADRADAQSGGGGNSIQTIANVAATAEVLATIVNTVALERVRFSENQFARNIGAAAFEEKIHYDVLVSDAVGGSPVTKRIWVPDAVFANERSLFTTLVVGDQIFINAYLLGLTVFARSGNLRGSRFARFLAEFMGAEAVHRGLALDALGRTDRDDGRIGNDRAFMRFAQREQTPGLPSTGQPGFYRITEAVSQLEAAGFGFGKEGQGPGRFYEYDEVSQRTPEPSVVNTRELS